MPRHDAKIDVVCDDCGAVAEWAPDFVYFDYTGNNGHYDTSDSAFEDWCEQNGWSQRGEDTFCPCREPEDD